MMLPISDDIILGLTHLLIDGRLVQLLRCPFCNFTNIHVDTITHHIRYRDDAKHWVDIEKLDKKMYFVTYRKQSPYGPYLSKQELPLPWIKCLWCSYTDRIERDLEWHFLENHRIELYREIRVTSVERKRASRNDPFSFMCDKMEYILEKAVKLAKQKSGVGNVPTNF
jgi:hypothetical protein